MNDTATRIPAGIRALSNIALLELLAALGEVKHTKLVTALAALVDAEADRRIDPVNKEPEWPSIDVTGWSIDEVLKIQRETANMRRDVAISERERRGDTVGASIARSRAKLSDDIFEIGRQISERMVANVSFNLRDPKIGALLAQAGTLTRIQGIDEKNIQADAIKAIDERMKANAADILASRNAAVEQERERQIRAIESQRSPRTSTLDGRDITGYLNQSRQVDQFAKSTADNTKAMVDKLDKLPEAIFQRMLSGMFIQSL